MAKSASKSNRGSSKTQKISNNSKSSNGRLIASLAAFADHDLLISLLLGFSTGITVIFSANVLGGLNAATPPLLVAALLTYFFALKFFFAPLVDKIPAPYFGKKFGHRRGVAMLVQILLIISLVLMSVLRQVPGLVSLSAAALVVIFSGLQILSFEALRVEMLPNNKQGHGVAMSIIGYFLLTLFVGLVGPAISNVGIDFILVFCVLQLLGILALVLAKSPDGKKEPFAWARSLPPSPISLLATASGNGYRSSFSSCSINMAVPSPPFSLPISIMDLVLRAMIR